LKYHYELDPQVVYCDIRTSQIKKQRGVYIQQTKNSAGSVYVLIQAALVVNYIFLKSTAHLYSTTQDRDLKTEIMQALISRIKLR